MAIKANKDNMTKKVVNKRAKSLKIYSISSVLIVLALLLVINILLYQTLNGILTFDTTSNKQNSVSEETIDYINSLPDDTNIRIVGLFDRPEVLSDCYEYTVPMLDNLAARSGGKISVSYINPTKVPNIINELDPNGVSTIDKYQNSVLYAVCCGDKIRVVDAYNDCFVYDQEVWNTYQQYVPTENKCESAFVNSIIGVTTTSSQKVYFLSEIQEKPHTYLDSVFASMNIEVAELPAVEPFSVPEDCSLLIINNPDIDISEAVQEGLKSYINNGTREANIICSLGISTENYGQSFEHINNVLNEVNLNVMNMYVFDDNSDYVVSFDGGIFRGDLVGSFVDYNSAQLIVYNLARPVVNTDRVYSHISSTPVVVTSDSTTLLDIAKTQESGSDVIASASNVSVAALGQYVGTTYPVNVYVFGTAALTSDQYLAGSSANEYNKQAIRNIISGLLTTDTNLDVPSKPIADFSIDYARLNSTNMSVISVVFIAVIPIVFVMIATVVYYKRSHL